MARRRDILDYRVAQAVEVLTRKSTEEDEASPAIRWYAKYMGTGERNLYKLVQRAINYGFKFGISMNYERIGIYLLHIVSEEDISLDAPTKMVARTIDGKYMKSYYIPSQCAVDLAKELKEAGIEYYFARIVWGSRPALASIPFLSLKSDTRIGDEKEKTMETVAKEVYTRGPPRIWGRKYPLDRLLLAIIEEADNNAIRSVASIAKSLGIETPKAQRKYYNLWARRVIMGYKVKCAPYCSKGSVFAVVSTQEPIRLAYTLPVLPPVLSASVFTDPATGREAVLLHITGEGDMVARTLSITKRLGGRVENLTYFYEEPMPEGFSLARQLVEEAGKELECPSLR
ncbi:MAG: hypothetical protein GSR85_03790 [Desulfurococcales archaeon]|nr:hypothetical protein [Desulfurococcales archaeon]